MGIKIFSVANVATLLTMFYLYASIRGIYNLMYPLNQIDVSSYTARELVKPYWKSKSKVSQPSMGMKVYLSTNPMFTADYVIDEFQQRKAKTKKEEEEQEEEEIIPRKRNPRHDSILLWDEPFITSASLSKSFILTSEEVLGSDKPLESSSESESESFQFATQWLDDADAKESALEGGGSGGGGITAVLSSAGDGIESTSVLLSLYKAVGGAISKLIQGGSAENSAEGNKNSKNGGDNSRIVVPISKSSSIWKNLMNNSTATIRVVLLRNGREDKTFQGTLQNMMKDEKSHNLLVEGVDMVKYDTPFHISKPTRYLYKDLAYILRRYILRMGVGMDMADYKPWDMSKTKPDDYKLYETAIQMKDAGRGYPFWKPEVAVKLVSEEAHYPTDFIGYSQMDYIQVDRRTSDGKDFESGYAYLPGLYVDEIGLTSEKYIPLNKTVSALPLRISFQSNDIMVHDDDKNSASGEGNSNSNSGVGVGLSPERWRLLRHLSKSLESQKELGFEQSDIDDVRRLIADTNVTLLGITVMASVLHMLFEFLTFKNDVEFWRGNKDLTGLSVRALYMDFISQTIILLYLIEKDSSLLMTIPAGCGCLIALWKCQRGAGLKFVKVSKQKQKQGGEMTKARVTLWNKFFRIFGYELQATRLRAVTELGNKQKKKGGNSTGSNKAQSLAALSEEMDQLASRMLGKYLMLPLILAYTVYTLIKEEHSGWYSWFITSASSAVYGLGFVFMTPQLFLNYKLKSVAHLPWKVLGYRFVNTFIDDLFAFIIRMPTMARISCFRDDIIFIIYLWQRYLYPVDASRPVEGGGMDAVSAAAQSAVVEDEDEKKNK